MMVRSGKDGDRDSFALFLTKQKYVLVIMILALVQVGLELKYNGFTNFPDTPDYLQTIEWYKDRSGEELPLRIQRPLEIVLAVPFTAFLSTADSLAYVNSVLYLISVPFIFSFSRKLLKDDKLAFISAVLFQFSFCVLYWGLALSTDMMLWLLMCVGFDLMVDVKEKWRTSDIYKVSIVVGLGILNKESIAAVALILIFLCLARLGRSASIKDRLRSVAQLFPELVIIAAPFVVMQFLMYVYFGLDNTFFGYHVYHKTGDVRGALWYLPITFLIGFNILFLPYLAGLRQFLSTNRFLNKREYIIALVLTLIPVVVFEQYSPRLAFLIFPFIIPVAAIGLKRMADRISSRMSMVLLWLFLILYIVANNIIAIFGDEVRDLLGIWSR